MSTITQTGTIQTLPADLPQNWTRGQVVAPDGTAVGLTEQHGFNYLCRQVNDAHRVINEQAAVIQELRAELSSKANKMSPHIYGFPFYNNYTNTTKESHFYKTQEDLVVVHLDARKADASPFGRMEYFAQMPEGFIPHTHITFPFLGCAATGEHISTGHMHINERGEVFVGSFTPATDCHWIIADVVYLSASI